MKVRGTMRFRDLGPGAWVLVAEDGQVYQLAGGDGGLCTDGLALEVEAVAGGDLMSVGMTGPILEVKRYRVLEDSAETPKPDRG